MADLIFIRSIPARENLENAHDFERALELVEEDHLKILLRETARVILSRRARVEAVATALLESGRLEALEIYRIIIYSC